ncbi:MAG TPA: hypothetical protein VFI06_16530 [Chitinophagaceae bacterium]|nr:hypothetical protein [Chitinophagaceae bacterium]
MINKSNYQEIGNGVKPYIFADEVTKRKIRRHLRDINDVITEKDIKNAKVPGVDETTPPAQPDRDDKKQQKNKVDDIPGNPVTPWDILDE